MPACWFDSDKVGGPHITALKREARWRQHRWAVDESVDQQFRHTCRTPNPPRRRARGRTQWHEAPRRRCLLRSQLPDTGHPQVAATRVATKQEHETLDAEAPVSRPVLIHADGIQPLRGGGGARERGSRLQLAELFGVTGTVPSDIVFEWSPARRSAKYTRDRTAFDVALRLGAEDGPRTVVGIETKYHEHSARRPGPARASRRRLGATRNKPSSLSQSRTAPTSSNGAGRTQF